MNSHDARIAIARGHQYREGEAGAKAIVLAIMGAIAWLCWYFSAAQVAKRQLRAPSRWPMNGTRSEPVIVSDDPTTTS